MRSLTILALAFPLVVVNGGCGDKEPAKAPDTAAAATSTAEPSSSEPPSSTAAATTPAEPAKPRKPFEIYSSCTDVVTVAFGADPKAANVGKRTIAPSSSIEGPRDADGNQVVWLLDNNGEPLIKVHVSRGMKKVEIGKSCRTLDAK